MDEYLNIVCYITDKLQTKKVGDWVAKIRALCGDNCLNWRFHKGRIVVTCHDDTHIPDIQKIIEEHRGSCPGTITWT